MKTMQHCRALAAERRNMNDKELLELAAKAAGIPVTPCTCSDAKWPLKHDTEKSGKRGHWNPLVDDGDALRLAVRLGLFDGPKFFHFRLLERFAGQDSDDYTANRRAIVRAAAEIGKAMP